MDRLKEMLLEALVQTGVVASGLFRISVKERTFKRYMSKKLVLFGMCVALAFFGLLGVLFVNIYNNHNKYSIEVLSTHRYSSETLQAKRGSIVDRNGTEMAICKPQYILILDCAVMNASDAYKEATIEALVASFGLNKAELRSVVEDDANANSNYLRYNGKTYVTEEQIETFEALQKQEAKNVKGVWFETEYQRQYPFSELACRVIGFTSEDGAEGMWGLENYYDSYLRGINGRVTSYTTEDGNVERTVYEATNGNTVVSTIDVAAQAMIEANIEAYMNQVGGENVGVILMDPNNGEILAMASSDGYDLNHPRDTSEILGRFMVEEVVNSAGYTEVQKSDVVITEDVLAGMSEEEQLLNLNNLWKNFCISDSYEPGSTAKTYTIAAGLEEGIISPEDEYYCQGYRYVGNYKIRCHIREGHGTLTVTNGLEESCNDVLMQIGWKIGAEIFCKYQQKFNLGQLTGIDLPGEASCEGLLYDVDSMGETELATSSFGQSFNVTMIQMASGVSSLINGGYYYQPHLVKEIRNENGAVVETKEPVVLRQTVSSETSEMMREMMYCVVENGTGGLCNIAGYSIGGKTGAGEKLPRSEGNYVISFISFTSVEDPQYLLYVVIDTPNVEDQSSSAQAQYLAREIWTDILPYFHVFTDESETGYEIDDPENPYVDDAYEAGIIEENPEEAPGEGENSGEEAPEDIQGEEGADVPAEESPEDGINEDSAEVPPAEEYPVENENPPEAEI